jgi:tetratricopeptide (TPR) repeat protein
MVFKEKPFGEAIILLTDRIMRCSHDRSLYDITYEYGYRSLVDFPYYKDVPNHILYNKYVSPHVDCLKVNRYSDNILPFINHLINKEEYQSALIEIERSFFFDMYDSDSILYANKLLCYRGLNDFEKGIFEYEVEYPEYFRNIDEVNIQAALLYYLTSNHESALNVLDKIIDKGHVDDIQRKAYTLKAIICMKEGQFQASESALHEAFAMKSDKMLYESNLKILEDIKGQKKKSPGLARVLSIIPGGGYLYTNHKGSALTAFIINSLLGYATYTSVRSENYGIAGVCGFMGLSFYIGNINGAGRSAIRYNERRYNSYIKKIENNNHIFIN